MTDARPPAPRYGHLLRLIDDTGVLEHARYGVPRREHGYTTDDAARALIVLVRASQSPRVSRSVATLLAFLLHAVTTEGTVHNRLSYERVWRDTPGLGDHHGRAMWALSVAATADLPSALRAGARSGVADLALPEGPHLRPFALAALGVARLWDDGDRDDQVTAWLERVTGRLTSGSRPWPEERLSYANGRIPHALIALGDATGDGDLVDQGLDMLTWLHSTETRDGRYSFMPVGGWSPGEPRPGFDQQPIEAAAMAAAALSAHRVTKDDSWAEAVLEAGRWLTGSNDAGTALFDPETSACCDGLKRDGVNANQGAESTIAAIEVLQACREVSVRTGRATPMVGADPTDRT